MCVQLVGSCNYLSVTELPLFVIFIECEIIFDVLFTRPPGTAIGLLPGNLIFPLK